MIARIYRPSRTAMQSGRANVRNWVLEFDSKIHRSVEPLMGWTSIDDMTGQVRLSFETREQAIAYAKRNGIRFSVEEMRASTRMVKSYSANFASDRKRPWTH